MSDIDISRLSTAQLEAALKARKNSQKDERAAKRKAYTQKRDLFIDKVFSKVSQFSADLKAFKGGVIHEGLALHTEMYEAFDRKPKAGVDNYTLTSDDGTKRVLIERQHRCEYDERAEVAIGQIREVLRNKFESRNKSTYAIIETLLSRNSKGDYDERMVAKLRAQEANVGDPRFSSALALLAESYKPVDTQMYIRVYQRDEAGKWVDLPMNFSRM